MKLKNLKIILWSAAIFLGFIQAWALRYDILGDIVDYLEMGEAYCRGDWKTALNGYYSPMYAWLLGFTMVILKPTPYWETVCVYFVNFIIYLFTLLCFEFFLKNLRASQKEYSVFSELILYTLGYTFFIFYSLTMISVSLTTPDMLVSAFVYLISGIILHTKNSNKNIVNFFFLGLVLALSYLTKAAMLAIGFVFLTVSLVIAKDTKKRLSYFLIAIISFSLVAGPFILALSKSKGYFTFGDVAKLNYAWFVNKLPENWDWQNSGKQIHPMKKIFNDPPVYELSSPFTKVTYPLAYDFSYWYEGVKLHFDLKEQLKVLSSSFTYYYHLVLLSQKDLILALLLLLLMSGRKWLCLKDISRYWFLLVPSIFAMLMYSLVVVEERYLGGFFVVLWTCLFLSVQIPKSSESKRFSSYIAVAVIIMLFIRLTAMTAHNIYLIYSDLIKGKDADKMWCIASTLTKMGLKPEDKVASITDELNQYWARLARVKIVAEIPPIIEDADNFWTKDDLIKSKVINAFANTGAKIIVTEKIPDYAIDYARRTHWEKIGTTEHYVYFLKDK